MIEWLKRLWAWLVITHFGIFAIVLLFVGAGIVGWGVMGEPKWLFPIGLVVFVIGLVWLTAGSKSDAVTPPAPVGPGETPVEPSDDETTDEPPSDPGPWGDVTYRGGKK